MKFDTRALHEGAEDNRFSGAVATPIFQSATFRMDSGRDYHDIQYLRLSNTPNHQLLHRRLASLESCEAAIVTSSGMSAISTALLSTLKSGDHALFQRVLYGGTSDLIRDELKPLGIDCDFIDPQQASTWKALLRPRTRLIYVETISNPLLEVPDLSAVVDFAKANGLLSFIDNTFASPVNFRPAELGFDVILHSATKYLNGHSDIVAGAVMGRQNLLLPMLHKLNHLGGCLDTHACFLLERGLKTLGLRVRAQNDNALQLAQFLSEQSKVKRVIYPGLESHPQYRRAREFFSGFGGMIAIEIDDKPEGIDHRLNAMQVATHAPSLGGVETLVIRPAASSHKGLSATELSACGISPGLLRISVGIEDIADLCEDFSRALR